MLTAEMKKIYICDPDKNKKCNKTSCKFLNPCNPLIGVCRSTSDVNCARTDEEGKPIIDYIYIQPKEE